MENVNLTLPEEPVLFTKEEIEAYGFTPAELDTLQEAESILRTANMLPEEPDKILDRIDKEIPNDANQAYAKFFGFADSDPEFFKLLLAFNEIVGTVSEVSEFPTEAPTENANVQKLSADEMHNQVVEELANDFISRL